MQRLNRLGIGSKMEHTPYTLTVSLNATRAPGYQIKLVYSPGHLSRKSFSGGEAVEAPAEPLF